MQRTATFYTKQTRVGHFYADTVYYGPFQQYGVPANNLPARRWLGIGPQMLNPMAKVIKKHVFRRGTVTLKAG